MLFMVESARESRCADTAAFLCERHRGGIGSISGGRERRFGSFCSCETRNRTCPTSDHHPRTRAGRLPLQEAQGNVGEHGVRREPVYIFLLI